MKRSPWFTTAWAPLVAVLVQLGHAFAIQPWMLDDAFIFFRYAENLTAGHGPVYNPGERVEGYTSFLWVVLLATGHALGADTPLLAIVLGCLFSIASILLVWSAWRWLPEVEPLTGAAAAFLLGTFGVFTPWAVSGMEESLFAFLVLLLVLLGFRATTRPAWLGILAALATMTRPEGLLVFGFLLVHRFWQRRDTRDAAAMIAGFAVLFVPWFGWRLAYYGYPFPNTFYAKVGHTWSQVARGAAYAGRFAIAAAPLLALIVAALVSRRWTRVAGRLRPLPWLLGLYTVAVVLLGGDAMPAFRFFTPIAPLLALGAALAARSLWRARYAMGVAILAAAYGVGGMRWMPEIHDHIDRDTIAEVGQTVGLWLRQSAPPDALLATNTAGSVPYWSRLRTIDMLGLNDEHIAHRRIPEMGQWKAGHEKHDGVYVLGRRPDYIQFGTSWGSQRPGFPGDLEIYSSREFAAQYELATYRLVGTRGTFTMNLYERKSGP